MGALDLEGKGKVGGRGWYFWSGEGAIPAQAKTSKRYKVRPAPNGTKIKGFWHGIFGLKKGENQGGFGSGFQ
jgi:hypothetical protein